MWHANFDKFTDTVFQDTEKHDTGKLGNTEKPMPYTLEYRRIPKERVLLQGLRSPSRREGTRLYGIMSHTLSVPGDSIDINTKVTLFFFSRACHDDIVKIFSNVLSGFCRTVKFFMGYILA